MQKVHTSQSQTQHSHQQVKEILLCDKCLTNLVSSISSVESLMVFRSGMFPPSKSRLSSNSASLTKETGCMNDSSGADVILSGCDVLICSLCCGLHWRVIRSQWVSHLVLDFALTCLPILLLPGLLSRHKHHLKWSSLVFTTDLQSVQENNFLAFAA